jgi:hypothetical protein
VRDHPSTGGVYNNGYADNLSVQLSPFPGPAPAAPSCQVMGAGGGGGGTGGGAPGARRTGPHEKLTYKRTQDVDRLMLFVRSDETARLTVSASVSVPAGASRTLRFKAVKKTLKAGKRTKIRLRLSAKRKRAVKRALHRGRQLKANVKLTATDAAGKRQVKRAKIRLTD